MKFVNFMKQTSSIDVAFVAGIAFYATKCVTKLVFRAKMTPAN